MIFIEIKNVPREQSQNSSDSAKNRLTKNWTQNGSFGFQLFPWADCATISILSFGTMDINALVINGSDPGAVPGGSTIYPSFGDHGAEIGSTNV